jgi:hypothetical protein
VTCLAEFELPHELGHPHNAIALLMRDVTVDDLDDSRGTIFEILAMINPGIAAFSNVTRIHDL